MPKPIPKLKDNHLETLQLPPLAMSHIGYEKDIVQLSTTLVVYSKEGLESHRLAFDPEMKAVVWAYTGMPVVGSRKAQPEFIYVMDMSGNLFVAFKRDWSTQSITEQGNAIEAGFNVMHHSSLGNAQKPFAAGTLKVWAAPSRDYIMDITNKSGHYLTPVGRPKYVIAELRNQGFSVSDYEEDLQRKILIPMARVRDFQMENWKQTHGGRKKGLGN